MDLNTLEFQQQMQEILQMQEMSPSLHMSMPIDTDMNANMPMPMSVQGMHMPLSMGLTDMHTQAPMQLQPVVDKHRKVLAVSKKRKAITPYIRFCSEQRPYLREKYPDATFIELGKMFGRMWNQLTDVQKAKYNTPTAQELAEEQDLEDAADHAASSSAGKQGKGKKRKTVTPYIRFCSEQRPFLKQKYPDATFIELGKMFGRIWNQLTELQKAKYAIAQPGEHGYHEEDEDEDEHNKPKRQKTITPYIRFCSEQRPFLKQKYPDMAFTDMGKMFGRMWNQLTDEQKANYATPREEY